MTKISLSLCVVVPLFFAMGGCTVSTCKGGECDFDDFGPDEDGGSGEGGMVVGEEGGATGGDGGTGDGGAGDAGQSITLEDFCFAQAGAGEAWRSSFDDCCSSAVAGSQDVTEFLQFVLRYTDTSVEGCVSKLSPAVDDGRVEYRGEHAMACAAAYAAAFESPPASCPAGGFDLIALEGAQGHGLQFPKQIAACRATFVGKARSGDSCTDQFECVGDLRCRRFSGIDNNTCQAALRKGTCVNNNECDDGFTCVGPAGTKQCLSNTDLAFSGGCEVSSECAEQRLCEAATCSAATGGTPICKGP